MGVGLTEAVVVLALLALVMAAELMMGRRRLEVQELCRRERETMRRVL